MVEKELNELVEILDKELELYQEILEISKNKSSIIAERKITELENIVKAEQSYILTVGKLENQREAIVSKIANVLAIDIPKASVSYISENLDESQSSVLKDYQDKFKVLFKDIKDVNALNARLLRNSLEYVDFSINLISSIDTGNNNYCDSGQLSESKKRNFFDVKL